MRPDLQSVNPSPRTGTGVVTCRLISTIAAIDAANRHDPNERNGQPLALMQGQAASQWLDKLAIAPSDVLRLAVRAHHLRRWEVARTSYPAGRNGYLRWRRDNKAHQAESLSTLMCLDGWPPPAIERARLLLGRTKLRTDPETQALEDTACLVFLETQFDEMADRTDHDHMASIVAKTLKKMSSDGVNLASSIGYSTTSQDVLADATTLLGIKDPDVD